MRKQQKNVNKKSQMLLGNNTNTKFCNVRNGDHWFPFVINNETMVVVEDCYQWNDNTNDKVEYGGAFAAAALASTALVATTREAHCVSIFVCFANDKRTKKVTVIKAVRKSAQTR